MGIYKNNNAKNEYFPLNQCIGEISIFFSGNVFFSNALFNFKRLLLYIAAKSRLPVTGLFFFVFYQTFAQPNTLYFKNYGEKEGLSELNIRRLLKDSRGYLWISTFNGLNRFDGYDFKVFSSNPTDSCAISNNSVLSLYEDTKGNIWIGTFNGLNKYNPITECFTHFFFQAKDSINLVNNMITDIVEDNQGSIWVSTNGGGIGKLDEMNASFKQFAYPYHKGLTSEHNSIISLEWSADNKLLVGYSGAGFAIMDTEKELFDSFKFDSSEEKNEVFRHNVIRDIYEDKNGVFWLASYKGLIKLNAVTKEYRIFLYEENNEHSLPANSVHDIEPANEDAIWLATYGGGLSYFHIPTQSFYNFNEQKHTINLTSSSFFNIKQEGEVLWIGSGSNGIFSSSLKETHLDFLTSSIFYRGKDKNLPITTFTSGAYPDMLMTFNNREIVAYNIATRKPSSPPYLNKLNESLNGFTKTFLLWQEKNILWIGTDRDGLFKYNVNTSELKHFKYESRKGALSHPHISELMLDKQGRLWVGTPSGINLFLEDKDEFISWNVNIETKNGLKNDYISALFNDSKGEVWIATESGLYQYNEQNQTIESYFQDDAQVHSLNGIQINAFSEDEGGNIWLGTRNGIFKMIYTDYGYSLKRYQPAQPLESNVINGLIYKKPNLWAATGKGVVKININDDSSVNFTWERIGSDYFSDDAHIKSTSKLIFFNRNASLILNPDSLNSSSSQHKIYITDVKIFNESVNESEIILDKHPDRSIPFTEELVLPHAASYLSFYFTAVDLSAPKQIRYAYRLKGFNEDWIFSGNRRYAAFSNLDPGTYYFEVKATGIDGRWGNPSAQLAVIIEPPFWRTWWFTLLGILFFLSILYALHRFRLERALEVERLRVRIASDLHDDIGATLTKISLYADLLNTDKQQTNENSNLIKKIGAMGRDTLRSLADIVWVIDARNDSLGNLISKIQEFAIDMLSKKDIEVLFKKEGIDVETSIAAETRQHVYLICKEAINNIFKHAGATKVIISFIAKNHKIDVNITDNGNGLPKNRKNDAGNGLRNIEQRAKKLNAAFKIEEANGLSIHLKGIGI